MIRIQNKNERRCKVHRTWLAHTSHQDVEWSFTSNWLALAVFVHTLDIWYNSLFMVTFVRWAHWALDKRRIFHSKSCARQREHQHGEWALCSDSMLIVYLFISNIIALLVFGHRSNAVEFSSTIIVEYSERFFYAEWKYAIFQVRTVKQNKNTQSVLHRCRMSTSAIRKNNDSNTSALQWFQSTRSEWKCISIEMEIPIHSKLGISYKWPQSKSGKSYLQFTIAITVSSHLPLVLLSLFATLECTIMEETKRCQFCTAKLFIVLHE